LKFNFVGAGPTTPPSFAVTDPGSHWQQQNWTLYVSGTLGAAGSLQVQVSPDAREIPDASARWFNQGAAITAIPAGPTQISLRFRKLRYTFTGGDATTNLVAEVV
jgi:hypothetical protein